eukprot:scaffold11490_cov135-Isochrysis_galbana.AAC.2
MRGGAVARPGCGAGRAQGLALHAAWQSRLRAAIVRRPPSIYQISRELRAIAGPRQSAARSAMRHSHSCDERALLKLTFSWGSIKKGRQPPHIYSKRCSSDDSEDATRPSTRRVVCRRARVGSPEELRPLLNAVAHGTLVLPRAAQPARAEGGAEAVVRVDAQRVRLGVEDDVVERELPAVAKEEKEVLERLGQKEGVHSAVVAAARPGHVAQPRVAHVELAVPFKRQEDGPAPLTVSRLPGKPPENEERLDRLGPQQVVPGVWVGGHTAPLPDVRNLGRQASGLLRVHSVARVHQPLGQRHVIARLGRGGRVARDTVAVDAGVHAQRQHARHEAHQVVHPVIVATRLVVPLANVRAVGAPARAATPHHVLDHPADGVGVHARDPRVRPARYEPLLEQVLVQRVGARAERHVGRRKLAVYRVDEGWVKPDRELGRPGHGAQVRHDALGRGLEDGPAGVPRQRPELELQRAHLGDARGAAAPGRVVPLQAPEADGAVWQPSGRVKGDQQPLAERGGRVEQRR